jgi:hypothetical protein
VSLLVPGRIEGSVVAITAEGDLVTSISSDQLKTAPRDPSVLISCGEHETVGLFPPDHQEAPMTFLAILKEGDPLKLVIVSDSAKMMLGIAVGVTVTVKW